MKAATFLEAGFPALPPEAKDNYFGYLPNDPEERIGVYLDHAFRHSVELREKVTITRVRECDSHPRIKNRPDGVRGLLNPITFAVTVPVDSATFYELIHNAWGSYTPRYFAVSGFSTPNFVQSTHLFALEKNSLWCE